MKIHVAAGKRHSDRKHPHACYKDGQLCATGDTLAEVMNAVGDEEFVEVEMADVGHVSKFPAEYKPEPAKKQAKKDEKKDEK